MADISNNEEVSKTEEGGRLETTPLSQKKEAWREVDLKQVCNY